jgi:hypothetical protein
MRAVSVSVRKRQKEDRITIEAWGRSPTPLKVRVGDLRDRKLRNQKGSSPRRSQLEPGLVERGTFQLKRLRRAAVIEFVPWNGSSGPKPLVPPVPKESRDPLKFAQHYQSLLDSGRFENRAALARYLGVSRARVTQVLHRLDTR